jgi:phosphonate transport system substrate-binding protein
MRGLKSIFSGIIVVLCLSLVLACQPEGQQTTPTEGVSKTREVKVSGEPLKIGYLICNSREETVIRFAPVAAYIGEKLGRKIIMIPMHTYEAKEDIEQKDIKFFKTNSIVYIQLKEKIGVNVMCGEKRGPLGRFTTGKIISKKGSGIKTFEDMKGKSFAFGPMFAPFGYLVQYDLMLRNGFDPEEDLAYYAIPWGAYKHEKAIYAVQMGAFDLGSAPDLDVIKMTEDDKIKMGEEYSAEEQEFNVIAESEAAPYCTFGSTTDADPVLARQIKQAMLELTPQDTVYMSPERLEVEGVPWDSGGFLRSGEVLNICKAGIITGYEEAKDSDYDGLREMMKRVNMDPYATFDEE